MGQAEVCLPTQYRSLRHANVDVPQAAANTPFSKDKLLSLFSGDAQGFLDMMNKLPKGTYCNSESQALAIVRVS
jgi:hypothetical protein